jgi:hypothetical protein
LKNHSLLLCLALVCAPAVAQNSPQQEREKACNADAAKKELKGDERKAFMKDCLGAKTEATTEKRAMSPQQQKMKKCNADARDKKLKGEERKAFMRQCLKKTQ